jgi:hypothetical protein
LGTSAADNLLPANFFGQIDQQTSDITVDLATGKFTVTYDGWYRVSFRVQCSGTISGIIDSLIYRNGAVVDWGPANASVNSISGSFDIYLAAGQYAQCGVHPSSTVPSGTGEAGALKSWMKIVLVNRSTL